MNSFILAFAAGIGIICSMYGWGWLITKTLRVSESAAIGHNAAVGLALSTSVGGLLNCLHAITSASVWAYLLTGLLLAAFATATQAKSLLARAKSVWVYMREHRAIALATVLLIVLILFKYAIAVSPGRFHPQDDYQGYFVFPVKMIQTGSLGMDPFSERRIQSSLGGKAFLDTFPLSLTGETRNLHLVDMGVAFLILLLLLAEIMVRKSLAVPWIIVILLAYTLFPAPVSNITAVYTGALLLILLFDFLDTAAQPTGLTQSAVLAIVLASIASLKTTLVPVVVVFWFTYFLFRLCRSPFRAKTIANAVLCAFLVVVFLMPWMLDSYRSSGTLFYPFLGRGFHGSRYGTYLLPTAQLGIRNILALLHGTQDVLFAVLAMQIGLLFLGQHWKHSEGRISVIIAADVVLVVVMIAGGTAGYQVFRYSFPVVFPGVLYLLIEEMAASKLSATRARFDFYGETASVALLCLLLGSAMQGFMAAEQDRLTDLKFSLTGGDINTGFELSAYRTMQLSIPAGQKMLVFLDKHFLLDFRRNPIYINDTPGGASLPPGMPIFKGPERLADYLVGVGVRYLAYSYADQANFTRSEFGSRLDPHVNVNLRVGAQIAFDFQDNVLSLGRSRKRLFDDGRIFVLDLATKVQPAGTVPTRTVPELISFGHVSSQSPVSAKRAKPFREEHP